ncbi:MAG: hypothetical protein WD512_19690, partial [Candidatus Paceibacterota bacterium]
LKYDVSRNTIRDIQTGKSWSGITGASNNLAKTKIRKRTLSEVSPAEIADALQRLKEKAVIVHDEKWETPHSVSKSLNHKGYGYFNMFGRCMEAHKASYILETKEELSDDLIVRHKCRIKACFEITHLETGTYKDNMNDKKRDGTNKSSNRKTEETIIEKVILQTYNTNDGPLKISKDCGVSENIVRGIIDKNNWSEITQRLRDTNQILDSNPKSKIYPVNNKKFTYEQIRPIILEIMIQKLPNSNIAEKYNIPKNLVADLARKNPKIYLSEISQIKQELIDLNMKAGELLEYIKLHGTIPNKPQKIPLKIISLQKSINTSTATDTPTTSTATSTYTSTDSK